MSTGVKRLVISSRSRVHSSDYKTVECESHTFTHKHK